MGILADLFVAHPADAPGYEEQLKNRDALQKRFERVEFKGLTDLEFSTLWALLKGEEWDLEKHALEEVTPAGNTWLFRFPSSFVQQLTSIDERRISDVSIPWAATEELQWEPSEAKEVVVELVRLARVAKSSSKGLFLWGSL